MSSLPHEKAPVTEVAEHSVPSTASVRWLLQEVLITDADLDAFCLDYFSEVHREFTGGMQRTAKVNLLLSYIPVNDIFARLKESYPAAVDHGPHSLPLPKEVHPPRPLVRLDSRERRNRQRMIEKVRKFWIEGVLEKSLHGAVMMELGMEYRPDAVVYPWDMVLERPDTAPQPIPKGKKMIELFDENLGELLILGAPGSGKTTMLLDLCRDLLNRAEADGSQPIPVVFNLTTWAQKRLPLANWLVEELARRYDLPKPVGQQWIETAQILPLLDGLDEVSSEYRQAAVSALNRSRLESAFTNVAICSRMADYSALRGKIRLSSAIVLSALSPEQIDSYLENIGQSGRLARELLSRDSALQELACFPLFLNILLRVSIDCQESNEIIDNDTDSENKRIWLFERYLKLAISRRPAFAKLLPEPEQSFQYLVEIAKQMSENNNSTYYLEEVQPNSSWTQSKIRLFKKITRFIFWLAYIGYICFANFFIEIMSTATPLRVIHWNNIKPALILWPLLLTLFSGWFDKEVWTRPIERMQPSWEGLRSGLRTAVNTSRRIILWLPLLAFRHLLPWWRDRRFYLKASVIHLATFSFILYKLNTAYHWPIMIMYIIFSTISAMALFAIFVLIVLMITVPVYGLKGFLFNCPEASRQTPNHGIMYTIQICLLALSFMCIINRMWNLDIHRQMQTENAFTGAAKELIGFALSAISTMLLWSLGGILIIRHYAIRIMFTLAGQLPLRLITFLNQCHECVLLRKVGGGYIFIHRLLMEYFASLTKEDIKRLAASVDSHK